MKDKLVGMKINNFPLEMSEEEIAQDIPSENFEMMRLERNKPGGRQCETPTLTLNLYVDFETVP